MNVLPGGMSTRACRQAGICPHISRRAGGFDRSSSKRSSTFLNFGLTRTAARQVRAEDHWAISASEVFAGVAVSDWPLRYAALTY
jgi:hypothetical protein